MTKFRPQTIDFSKIISYNLYETIVWPKTISRVYSKSKVWLKTIVMNMVRLFFDYSYDYSWVLVGL